jgi:4-amino-4-deoxy-L-arabinose transferase-like glycosyltransferase
MHRVITWIFLAFLTLIVRLLWLGMVPVAEAPDELTHLWVIRFLLAHMRLPSGQEVLAAGPVAVYGSIPQLGYVPHLIAIQVLPNLTDLIAARAGSLVMVIITVLLARAIALRVFAGKPLLEWSLPLVLVFHPQLVFVGAYVNNDSTACALSSAILLLLIDSLARGLRYWRSLLVGILIGWLVLTKYSGFSVIPCAGIYLIVAGLLRRVRLTQIWAHLALTFGTAVGLSGWWFVRNSYEFHGDITGSNTLFKTWTEAYHRKVDAAGSPFLVVTQSRWWRMNFFSFWGWFGYMTRSLPRLIYYGYICFVSLSLFGFVHRSYRRRKNRGTRFPRFIGATAQSGSEQTKRAIWSLMWLCVLINFAMAVYGTASGVSGPQGRYFFSSEIPLMSLMLAGLAGLPAKYRRGAILSFVGYNIFCYAYASWYLYSLYGFSIFAPS